MRRIAQCAQAVHTDCRAATLVVHSRDTLTFQPIIATSSAPFHPLRPLTKSNRKDFFLEKALFFRFVSPLINNFMYICHHKNEE